MWCLLAEMQMVFQDMPIAGELVKQNTGGDVAESDKSYGFCHRGTDNQLFVFEAAIDLLSFYPIISQRLEQAELPESGWHFQCGTDGFFFLNALRLLRFSCAWIMTRQGMKPVRKW